MKWTKRGPKWKEAVEVCMALIEASARPTTVKKAFEAAAEEEGLLRSSTSARSLQPPVGRRDAVGVRKIPTIRAHPPPPTLCLVND
nr:DUF982 domain-containing protein [Mesorhizobium sp. AA22]